MSPSSTPSCSVRTSLTRSKTSSRDAAMSPRLWGRGRRAAGLYHGLREPLRQSSGDVVLDTTGREANRVGDRTARRIAVRDDGEVAQPEQIRAAVRVRIE